MERTENKAQSCAGEQFAGLKAGESTCLDQVIGDGVDVFAAIERQGTQQQLKRFATEQPAAQDRLQESLNRGRRRARRRSLRHGDRLEGEIILRSDEL